MDWRATTQIDLIIGSLAHICDTQGVVDPTLGS